jgi:hypothetical protein
MPPSSHQMRRLLVRMWISTYGSSDGNNAVPEMSIGRAGFSRPTVEALLRRGLIERRVVSGAIAYFRLTEEGRVIAEMSRHEPGLLSTWEGRLGDATRHPW